MRLTLELLQQAPQSLNPANERQLLLRGYKIPTVENLGGSNDAYECIDLSDNDLIKLANFPPLKRLHVLLLVNNRISRIASDCFDTLPNLRSIVLTGNKLEKLVDLEALTKIKSLERLSLLENPCTKIKHYRAYMIFKCSDTMRILDFNRIKDKERKAAAVLFAGERGEQLLAEIAPARAAGKELADKAVELQKSGPSAEAIERIKRAIAEAETIEEVTRLEKALKSGVLPDDLKLKDEKTFAKSAPPSAPTTMTKAASPAVPATAPITPGAPGAAAGLSKAAGAPPPTAPITPATAPITPAPAASEPAAAPEKKKQKL